MESLFQPIQHNKFPAEKVKCKKSENLKKKGKKKKREGRRSKHKMTFYVNIFVFKKFLFCKNSVKIFVKSFFRRWACRILFAGNSRRRLV